MAGKNPTKLSASWQLNAALLSRPVDLTALVSMVIIIKFVNAINNNVFHSLKRTLRNLVMMMYCRSLLICCLMRKT